MNQLGGTFRRADGETYLHNQSERPVGLATARLAQNPLCKCYCAVSCNKVFLAGDDSQPDSDIERASYISREDVAQLLQNRNAGTRHSLAASYAVSSPNAYIQSRGFQKTDLKPQQATSVSIFVHRHFTHTSSDKNAPAKCHAIGSGRSRSLGLWSRFAAPMLSK
jgi:hypothetical protein